MKSLIDEVYSIIANDSEIKRYCDNRISVYQYPFYNDENKPFVVIRPLEAVQQDMFASDDLIRGSQLIQIDVQSPSHADCFQIQNRINELLMNNGIYQQSGGLDEKLEKVNRYVDARRYEVYTALFDLN